MRWSQVRILPSRQKNKNMKKNKKDIKNSHSKKTINPNFYSTIKISDIKEIDLSKEDIDKGYMFVPYILSTEIPDSPSSKEYDKFMKKYNKEHDVCPKCGSQICSTTLVGYFLNMEKKEEYKDLNNCVCQNCGDKHTWHDRISIKEYNKKNKK
jgi:hypothetical protein